MKSFLLANNTCFDVNYLPMADVRTFAKTGILSAELQELTDVISFSLYPNPDGTNRVIINWA